MWMNELIYINTLSMVQSHSSMIELKNNNKQSWKYLEQKWTWFYHVQVNLQVKLMLRFLQVSPTHSPWRGDHLTMLLYKRTWSYFVYLVVEDAHWIFGQNTHLCKTSLFFDALRLTVIDFFGEFCELMLNTCIKKPYYGYNGGQWPYRLGRGYEQKQATFWKK